MDANTESAVRATLPFGGFVVDELLRLTVVVVFLAMGAAPDSEDEADTHPTATTIAMAGKTTIARCRDLRVELISISPLLGLRQNRHHH